jgi:hypothetical protein
MYKIYTIYQHNFDNSLPYIKRNTFKLDKTDKVEETKDGLIHITLVDAHQSGHNGDWYDSHEYGYLTFEQAKKALIKRSKEDAKKELDHIKSLSDEGK